MILKNPDAIYEWDINQLWTAFQEAKEQEPFEINGKITYPVSEKFLEVKYGYLIQVPIFILTEQRYQERAAFGTVSCHTYGKMGS